MKSGRRSLECIKCQQVFSTHSSNRELCYKCKPKCRERHVFYINAKPVEVEKETKEVKKVKQIKKSKEV